MHIPNHPIERQKADVKSCIHSLIDGGEDTSGLDDVLSTDRSPRDVRGVTLSEDLDGLSLNPELAILGLDGALEATVDGVELEHVDHVVEIDEGAIKRNKSREYEYQGGDVQRGDCAHSLTATTSMSP